MTKQFIRTIWIVLLAVTLIQCNSNQIKNTVKLLPNDPFKNTVVASETFDIDSKQDNVVEGENGTIIVCPKGCFKNSKGDIVEDIIKIELSEAFTIDEMLLSNLTTTSNGKPLETDGMIYFNATANGEQLTINKDNPIHIEIPTYEKKPGMMAYKGIRDEKGNMNWIEPKELDKYLKTVNINSLDFLPEGFQREVDNSMPYKNYKTATQGLTDSLYYKLSVSYISSMLQELITSNYNGSYDYEINNNLQYNEIMKKFADEKRRVNSYLVESGDTVNTDTRSAKSNWGIDPAIIKVIKSEKYQNTLIATKEFEARLKVIFNTCNNAVLEIYIKNLNKNLYELDSMAAVTVGESEIRNYQDFLNFSNQRLTKVKQADKYAVLLKDYYGKQLFKVKSELEKQQATVLKELNKKNEQAQKVAADYEKLLLKREKYSMETYGFNWTETGWINVDNGTLPKDWGKEPLEITIDNGKQFDRVYTYVIYTSIKSLCRLNTTDNEQFYAGSELDKEMLMPKQKPGVAVAIGYKGEVLSLAIKEFKTGSEPKFSLNLLPSTLHKVKEAISPYEKYAIENKISKDLEFMAKFYKEELLRKFFLKDSELIFRLWNVAFPCCEIPYDLLRSWPGW